MIFSSRISRRATLAVLSFSLICLAQKDPGVRGGPPGAGGPLAGLQVNELALFTEGTARLTQLEAVCDTCSDVTLGSVTGQDPNLVTLTNSSGLGARFNGDQCSVLSVPPAAGNRWFRWFSCPESARSAQPVQEAREPHVRPDPASERRPELRAVFYHAVWPDPRSAVPKTFPVPVGDIAPATGLPRRA